MDDIKKINLLVNIARLYYEHDYSQQMIAKKTGFSRPYVSKLINEARESGIVEIKINDPNDAESEMESEIRNKFNLLKVIVVPNNDNLNHNLQEQLSEALSRYLNIIMEDNDVIGVGWGSTMHSCAENLHPAKEVKNTTVVQLCGAISMIEKNIFASEIPKKFADAYNSIPYILTLPAVVDDVKVKNAILKDKNIDNVMNIGMRSNIAIFTMGVLGYDSALVRAGYLNKSEVDKLIAKGAVGDVCSRIIDIDGRICDKKLDNRTIGIQLEDLKQKKYKIGVASGINKAKCIFGALNAGYSNVLITDENTAKELLKINN